MNYTLYYGCYSTRDTATGHAFSPGQRMDRGPGLGWVFFFLVLTGAKLQTPGLLLPRWSCRPSQAPAAGIFHHWLEACSSSAGPGPLGPCKKNKNSTNDFEI